MNRRPDAPGLPESLQSARAAVRSDERLSKPIRRAANGVRAGDSSPCSLVANVSHLNLRQSSWFYRAQVFATDSQEDINRIIYDLFGPYYENRFAKSTKNSK